MKSIYYLLFAIIVMFSGCIQQKQSTLFNKQNTTPDISSNDISNLNNNTYTTYNQDLNKIIVQMADQLFKSNTVKNKKTKIILTSYVDLDHLGETTTFGRLLSESMFNELHINKFNVTDFRGQNAVSVTKDGEFHITRDTEKLKDTLDAIEFILVGTYVKFENSSYLINSRIIDSISGEIISSSRVIYKPKDCKLYSLCQTKTVEKAPKIVTKPIKKTTIKKSVIMIVEDK